jgi:H+/Cl- antiporter ClcA
MKHLDSKEELEFLKEIHGGDVAKVFGYLRESFALLQTRSQMLLGLATICLTITGFSGPRMAASNPYSRWFIGTGLLFVLSSVVCIVSGPLRLRWMTAWRAEDMDQTLISHLQRRDFKTRLYKAATACLLTGLSCYLGSVVCYLSVVE